MHAVRRALIAGLTMAIAAPSAAEPAGQASVSVRYSDLDLGTAEGTQVLESRLRRAARQVCAIERSRERWDFEVTVSCRRLTTAHAMAGVRRAWRAAEQTRLAVISAPATIGR